MQLEAGGNQSRSLWQNRPGVRRPLPRDGAGTGEPHVLRLRRPPDPQLSGLGPSLRLLLRSDARWQRDKSLCCRPGSAEVAALHAVMRLACPDKLAGGRGYKLRRSWHHTLGDGLRRDQAVDADVRLRDDPDDGRGGGVVFSSVSFTRRSHPLEGQALRLPRQVWTETGAARTTASSSGRSAPLQGADGGDARGRLLG